MRVAIVTSPDLGARPDLDDNAEQAVEIAECLTATGHQPSIAPYAPAAPLPGEPDDVVFNLVEDLADGSGNIYLAAERFAAEGRRYTGCRADALKALGDKRTMKTRLAAAGLPVPAGLGAAGPAETYIVKSATEHASLGLTHENVVAGVEAAQAMLERRRGEFGGDWYAEAYVEGREFNLGLLELDGAPTCLPIAEIAFAPGTPHVVGYDAKWIEGSAGFAGTPRVFPPDELPLFAELRRQALAAWDLFGLGGCARVDFRVDGANRPVILEVNANPCLARDAGLCAAAERAGLSQIDVVTALLAAAR